MILSIVMKIICAVSFHFEKTILLLKILKHLIYDNKKFTMCLNIHIFFIKIEVIKNVTTVQILIRNNQKKW